MLKELLDSWHGFTLKSGLTEPSHGRYLGLRITVWRAILPSLD